MRVTVRVFANLRDYAPGRRSEAELVLADGARVADVRATLGVPEHVQAVLLVNGRRAEAETVLSESDEVTLFPPMEGG